MKRSSSLPCVATSSQPCVTEREERETIEEDETTLTHLIYGMQLQCRLLATITRPRATAGVQRKKRRKLDRS